MNTSDTTKNGIHHFFMRIMVWNMRWMTRYAGFIARPIVQIYGNNEIIACGLRNEDNTIAVIYTPKPGHQNHAVLLREEKHWVPETSTPAENFSGSVVSRRIVPQARNGMRYKMFGYKQNGRRLSSPTITVKPATIYDCSLLEIKSNTTRDILFTWPSAERHDPMIYFLAVEDETREHTCAAIYTRETFWHYPKTNTASYSVGPAVPPYLAPGKTFLAKLVLVDYDGWVSHIAVRSFSVF